MTEGISGNLGYAVTELGITFRGTVEYNDWSDLGDQLSMYERGVQWMLGDWLLYGENKSWGQRFTQALDAGKFTYSAISQYKWVASRFPHKRRRPKLTWTHHRHVAGLQNEVDQEYWLTRAEEENWTSGQLLKALQEKSGIAAEGNGGGEVREAPSPIERAKKDFLGLSEEERSEFYEWVVERMAEVV